MTFMVLTPVGRALPYPCIVSHLAHMSTGFVHNRPVVSRFVILGTLLREMRLFCRFCRLGMTKHARCKPVHRALALALESGKAACRYGPEASKRAGKGAGRKR